MDRNKVVARKPRVVDIALEQTYDEIQESDKLTGRRRRHLRRKTKAHTESIQISSGRNTGTVTTFVASFGCDRDALYHTRTGIYGVMDDHI
jgi:hypothetical protein